MKRWCIGVPGKSSFRSHLKVYTIISRKWAYWSQIQATSEMPKMPWRGDLWNTRGPSHNTKKGDKCQQERNHPAKYKENGKAENQFFKIYKHKEGLSLDCFLKRKQRPSRDSQLYAGACDGSVSLGFCSSGGGALFSLVSWIRGLIPWAFAAVGEVTRTWCGHFQVELNSFQYCGRGVTYTQLTPNTLSDVSEKLSQVWDCSGLDISIYFLGFILTLGDIEPDRDFLDWPGQLSSEWVFSI